MDKLTLKLSRLADNSVPTVGKICHACFELQEYIKGMDLINGNKGVVLSAVEHASYRLTRNRLCLGSQVSRSQSS